MFLIKMDSIQNVLLVLVIVILVYRHMRTREKSDAETFVDDNQDFASTDAQIKFTDQDQSSKQYWDQRILGYGAWSRPEHVGWRWKDSWRPYYYNNYPMDPIWLPARPASLDKEREVLLASIDDDQCKLYAEGRSKDSYYKQYEYNKAYGKCVDMIYA